MYLYTLLKYAQIPVDLRIILNLFLQQFVSITVFYLESLHFTVEFR
jgi:hypothetical protein